MLSLNTNMTSLMVQNNLKKAMDGLNSAMKKLTTGKKINSAKDNPANYALAKNIETKLRAWNVAQDNIMMGYDMLETASSSAELIYSHMTRIRDLCEQACNGTYGEASKKAIKAEIAGRIDEINRIKSSTEYNDIKIFGDIDSNGNEIRRTCNIQAGIDSSKSSVIQVDTTLSISEINDILSADISSPEILDNIDNIINNLSEYQTRIGSSQNRLEYALDYIDVTTRNLSSSLSTLQDADIAEVSSELIKYQILQQACITLLSTANQMPAMALQLL